jgi:hypothetical protein
MDTNTDSPEQVIEKCLVDITIVITELAKELLEQGRQIKGLQSIIISNKEKEFDEIVDKMNEVDCG